MKKLVLFVVMLFAGILVFAQEKSKSKGPDQQISVKKEYDEQGNLIRYDSSLVRSWSSDTTLNMADLDAMQFMKGSVFSHFFGDSASLANGPFPDLHKDPFERFHGDIPDSVFNWNDTTGTKMPGMRFPFSDFDKMQEQMMEQFGQFFQNDSIHSGNQNFNFFFDQDEFKDLQKEFEERFNQGKDSTIHKMGASETKYKPEVLLL
jgi:hypothetical protein